MYLHIGENVTVKSQDIIGIFDMDNTSRSKKTQCFLKRAEREDRLIFRGDEIPKAFVVTNSGGDEKIYFTVIAAATIQKRTVKDAGT